MTSASIVMPARDAARFIRPALDSLSAQTFADFEVVVVDDGSRDDTARIVADAAARDGRIRLLSIAHAGVAAARNHGVRAARGAFVSFLDADDLWRPDRLARHVAWLAQDPSTDVVAGEVLVFEAIGETFEPVAGSAHVRLRSVNLGATTMRASVFGAIGLFDEAMRFSEDLDFLLRIHEGGLRIAVESEVALFHRRHAANMTNDAGENRRFILQALQRSMARRRASGYRQPATEFPLQTPFDQLAMSPADVGRGAAGGTANGKVSS